MKASVVVPVKNGESTIRECLQALFEQTLEEEFEVIVVDDGSTDNTAKIVKEFPEAKLIQQNSLGPARARNNGAKKAKGEIVVFTDADCVPSENWLREMIKPFEDERVGGVQGAYKTKQSELIARFSQIEIEYRYKRMSSSPKIDWIGSYSAAYGKEVFLDLGGFEEKFKKASGEDPDLSYSIQEKGYRIEFNPSAIVFHKHPVSLFQYLKKKFKHAYWRVLLYKRHKRKALSDSYTPQFLKAQIGFLALFFAILPLSLISDIALFFALLPLFFLVLCMLPFVFFALKHDFFIGLLSFGILFLRDIAFLLGLVMGGMGLFFNKFG